MQHVASSPGYSQFFLQENWEWPGGEAISMQHAVQASAPVHMLACTHLLCPYLTVETPVETSTSEEPKAIVQPVSTATKGIIYCSGNFDIFNWV